MWQIYYAFPRILSVVLIRTWSPCHNLGKLIRVLRCWKHRELFSCSFLNGLSLRHINELVNWRGHLLLGISLLCLSKVLMRRGWLILSLSITPLIVVRAVSIILLLSHSCVPRDYRHRSIDTSSGETIAPCSWGHIHAMTSCGFGNSIISWWRTSLNLGVLRAEAQCSLVCNRCGSFKFSMCIMTVCSDAWQNYLVLSLIE